MILESDLNNLLIKGVEYGFVIGLTVHFAGYGISLLMRMFKGL